MSWPARLSVACSVACRPSVRAAPAPAPATAIGPTADVRLTPSARPGPDPDASRGDRPPGSSARGQGLRLQGGPSLPRFFLGRVHSSQAIGTPSTCRPALAENTFTRERGVVAIAVRAKAQSWPAPGLMKIRDVSLFV